MLSLGVSYTLMVATLVGTLQALFEAAIQVGWAFIPTELQVTSPPQRSFAEPVKVVLVVNCH